ncbi:hypothetical protein EV356DRAFT_521141 [Viridothelium virens]|uniref:BTB domain-containing protein n=1 Tax=Viridothelium virens TaxID=1048519 RepID=A0A6A6GV64_VIRVR|nr:hypothetical protein EV356DRAFT_521141 [Viridothelium virens]
MSQSASNSSIFSLGLKEQEKQDTKDKQCVPSEPLESDKPLPSHSGLGMNTFSFANTDASIEIKASTPVEGNISTLPKQGEIKTEKHVPKSQAMPSIASMESATKARTTASEVSFAYSQTSPKVPRNDSIAAASMKRGAKGASDATLRTVEQCATGGLFDGYTCSKDEHILKSLSGNLYDEAVQLVADNTRFTVHRSLLNHFSYAFSIRLSRQSADMQSATTSLELDSSIEVVRTFRNWLYTQRFCDEIAGTRTKTLELSLLCETYLFGKEWQIRLLKNAAVNAIIEKCRHEQIYPDLRTAAHVYHNTSATDGSELRRLLVDITVQSKSLQSFSDSASQEVVSDAAPFLFDVAIAAGKRLFAMPHPLLPKYDTCVYHDHPGKESWTQDLSLDGSRS